MNHLFAFFTFYFNSIKYQSKIIIGIIIFHSHNTFIKCTTFTKYTIAKIKYYIIIIRLIILPFIIYIIKYIIHRLLLIIYSLILLFIIELILRRSIILLFDIYDNNINIDTILYTYLILFIIYSFILFLLYDDIDVLTLINIFVFFAFYIIKPYLYKDNKYNINVISHLFNNFNFNNNINAKIMQSVIYNAKIEYDKMINEPRDNPTPEDVIDAYKSEVKYIKKLHLGSVLGHYTAIVINKELSNLYLHNIKGQPISLEANLNDILLHLGLSERFVNYDISDIYLFKYQLWMEEQMFFSPEKSFNTPNIGTESLIKIMNGVFDNLHQDINKFKFLELIKFHINIDYIISIIYGHLNGIGKNLTRSTFYSNIGRHYAYYLFNTFYFNVPLNERLPFHEWKSTYEVQVEIIGAIIAEPFFTNNIFTTYIKNNRTFIDFSKDYKVEHSEVDFSFNILPMFLRPIDYKLTSNNKLIEGGNFRSDLYFNELIHANYLDSHHVQLGQETINAINKLNNTKFRVNFDMVNHIWNENPSGIINDNELDNNTFLYTFSLFYKDYNVDLYLPVYLDWRTRIYCNSYLLNYQGNDLNRSLILLSNNNPDNYNLTNLFISGANLYGKDKLALNEKIKFIQDNINNILTLNKEFINQADEKYQFIAFCYYLISIKNKTINNSGFIHFRDATCSGTQHIACLLNDINLGYQVNLCPSNVNTIPNDIYSSVLPHFINALISKNIFNKDSLELNIINRKFIKKSIMTLPYAVTVDGIKDQLTESAYKQVINTKTYYIYYDNYNFVRIDDKIVYKMAHILYNVTIGLYPSYKLIFKYINGITNIYGLLNIPFTWSTPVGNRITCMYNEEVKDYLNITIHNTKRKFLVSRDITNKLDTYKFAHSIVPNIIHSFDASVLIRTINKLPSYVDLIPIHDCFGVLSCHYNLLEQALKESFVELYNIDFFDILYNNLINTLNNKNIKIHTIIKNKQTYTGIILNKKDIPDKVINSIKINDDQVFIKIPNKLNIDPNKSELFHHIKNSIYFII